ncbi:TetR/AcrR family transcriptional regulator [Nocardiopsis sp. EMB25]|uniref:TetR/AcrR family transcriptional regulator n=1 Tax=Nocardiopsis sp. EMB25 TaxID=2835867 RepID=UPI002284F5EB|nr:TetR/AcrR family transcriptional regulator [Nocardiopsis sp. EMB25]MCY9784689.1 TetR/AcrR family transcriptional regulator [Nocardiopsis sp. EMB25]
MPRAGLSPRLVAEEAARLIDEQGLDALSLAAVAKRFGVAVPSLYKHVDGLTGLRREVGLLGAAELGERLRASATGLAGVDALRAVAAAYRRYAHTHPGRYAALQRAPGGDDREARRVYAIPVEVLTAVLSGFGIDGDQAVHAVRALRSALHGFVDLEAQGGFGLPEDVDESYGLLVEGFVRAFRSWPGTGPARIGDEKGAEGEPTGGGY